LEGKKAKYCKSCKTSDMRDVRNNKCVCGKRQPSYNLEGEKAKYCILCKTSDMVDVKNKKCHCGKRIAIYNIDGEIAKYCGLCKSSEMINVCSTKCHCGKSQPSFNIEGEQAKYCISCKTSDMVNVISKMCVGIDNVCPLGRVANKKYRDHCIECFRRKFPLDPLTLKIQAKTKEIAVRDFINENFDGFEHDKPLYTGHCQCIIRRRIDHRKLIGGTLLAIETDENQHKNYDEMDEETRYNDLYMAYSGKWVYIRFNPDKYFDENRKTKNPSLHKRLEILKSEISKQIMRIENNENTDLVENFYLFYDK
jgi:hypothetical protein